MASLARRPASWRWLGRFWLGLLLLLATGGMALYFLGPLPRPVALLPLPPPAPVTAPPAQVWDGHIAAPEPALLEASPAFPSSALPRIASDGRLPRLVYARPAPLSGTRPRIALVVAGFGLSSADSRAAIDALPGAVTLAFSAYTPTSEPLAAAARARGHELLASLPMEAEGFPWNDAGPRSLLTGAPPAANRENLEWAMSRLQGYVGLTGASDGLRGERFAGQTSSFNLMLDEVARRGLLYVDPRPGARPPRIAGRSADLVVDDPPTRAEIEAKLLALERAAREHGSALGLAGPLRPLMVERIAAWARDVEARGFELVPVTALVLDNSVDSRK